MESYGILQNPMESYGILWNLLESFGFLENSLKFYAIHWTGAAGIFPNPLESFRILQVSQSYLPVLDLEPCSKTFLTFLNNKEILLFITYLGHFWGIYGTQITLSTLYQNCLQLACSKFRTIFTSTNFIQNTTCLIGWSPACTIT